MNAPTVFGGLPRVQIDILPLRGEYRLSYERQFIGSDSAGTSDVHVLGDDLCENLGDDCARDALGYVFASYDTANRVRRKIVEAVLTFRRGES